MEAQQNLLNQMGFQLLIKSQMSSPWWVTMTRSQAPCPCAHSIALMSLGEEVLGQSAEKC
jgi:hypothetical protein